MPDEIPMGGSLSELLAATDDALDQWITNARGGNTTTPELTLLLLMHAQSQKLANPVMTLSFLLATAIQRLA